MLIASTATDGLPLAQRDVFYARLLDEVRRLPGVVAAAVASDRPASASRATAISGASWSSAPRPCCAWRRNAAGSAWVMQLLERKRPKVVAVALANKTARVAWAVMARGEIYAGRAA